jgi:hypothetical protein
MRPSRLEQVDIPSVFHTEVYNNLGKRKVDVTFGFKRSDPLSKDAVLSLDVTRRRSSAAMRVFMAA